MKSEIFVKSTADLSKEVDELDAKADDKSISEILDEQLRRDGISGSHPTDNEQYQET